MSLRLMIISSMKNNAMMIMIVRIAWYRMLRCDRMMRNVAVYAAIFV